MSAEQQTDQPQQPEKKRFRIVVDLGYFEGVDEEEAAIAAWEVLDNTSAANLTLTLTADGGEQSTVNLSAIDHEALPGYL